jgi:hypothetical protein
MRPRALALVLLACRPDTAGPAATTPGPATTDSIDADLERLLEGDDGEPLARALAQADAYAQRLAARHEGRARSEPAYADKQVAPTLARLHARAPDRAAMSARTLLDAFTMLLQRPDLDDRRRRAITEQTQTLRVLAGAIDRPTAPGAKPVRPDRVCAVATPEGHGLLAEVACTCGEPLACRIVRRDGALELAVEQLPGPAVCDDCYAGWTTCTLDRLAPGERVRVVVDGRELGALTADGAGRLPVGTCLPGAAP